LGNVNAVKNVAALQIPLKDLLLKLAKALV
jgi:hypothetical protein